MTDRSRLLLRGAFLLVVGTGGAAFLWAPEESRPPLRAGTSVRPGWGEVVIDRRSATEESLLPLAERLYGWNCLPCHGVDGRGDGPVAERMGLHPRDLARGVFLLTSSIPGDPPRDEDLYRTITVGIPSSGMPGFSSFEPEDRWALVAWIKRLSHLGGEGDKARMAELPPRPATLDPVRGEHLFGKTVGCSICHGPTGKGDGPAGRGLLDLEGRPVPMPEFSRGALAFKSGNRPEDLVRVLTLGMPGSPMPSFSALSSQDRWDLAAFIATLYQEIPEGERVWLSAGCLSCHTVGQGKRVGPDLEGLGDRRRPEWLRKWLEDPPRMLQDPALRAEFREYPVTMPRIELSEREIELLVGFLGSLRSKSHPRSGSP